MIFKTRLKHSYHLIDLTALVDVMFLLLIFFLVTSDVLPLKSLNVENPRLPKDSLPLTTQLLVVMDAQQVLYFGSKKDIVDLTTVKDEVIRELATLHEMHPNSQPTLVLSVDRRVEYDAFLKLLSAVHDCGCPIRLAYRNGQE